MAGEGGESSIKRSKALSLFAVHNTSYITQQIGGGVCFGDSGGPGLLTVGDDQWVIGVNSTVVGDSECLAYSNQARADAHKTWIDRIMGAVGADCREDATLCGCAQACQPDGVCDEAQCGQASCSAIWECLGFCRQSATCQVGCLLDANPEANYLFDQYLQCFQERCEDQDEGCGAIQCHRQLYACDEGLDAVTGDADCGSIQSCVQDCRLPGGCVDDCFFEGTLEAQAAFAPLETCTAAAGCNTLVQAEREACVHDNCRIELLSCRPSQLCRLVGGDCPAGQACVPAAWGGTYCVDSDGIGVDEPCEPGQCADGTLCVGDDTPVCREVCVEDGDCDVTAGPCVAMPVEALPFSVGVCGGCTDTDDDGTCDADDCAPQDVWVHPGAREICDGVVDENCDGVVDEGCPAPPQVGCPECAPRTAPAALERSSGCAVGGSTPGWSWLWRRAAPGRGLSPRPVVSPAGASGRAVADRQSRDLGARVRGLRAVFPWAVPLSACTDGAAFSDTVEHVRPVADAVPEGTDYIQPQPPPPDPDPTIVRIQQGLVPPGELVVVRAVVSSQATDEGFFVSDGIGGPWSGLWVSGTADVSPGDEITLHGFVGEEGSGASTVTRTQLVLGEAPEITGMAALPEPVVFTLEEFGIHDLAELYEGVVVTLEPATVSGRTEGGTIVVESAVGLSDRFVPLEPSWHEPGTTFSRVTGPLDWNVDIWTIAPRDADDMPRVVAALGGCIPMQGYALCTAPQRRWTRARSECARRGGRLAVLETADENLEVGQLVERFIDAAFYLGISDRDEEGVWRWIDGSLLSYEPWADGEPNDAGGGEDCVHSNWSHGTGAWNDIRCGAAQPFLCEFPPEHPARCTIDADCAAGPGVCVDGNCDPEPG